MGNHVVIFVVIVLCTAQHSQLLRGFCFKGRDLFQLGGVRIIAIYHDSKRQSPLKSQLSSLSLDDLCLLTCEAERGTFEGTISARRITKDSVIVVVKKMTRKSISRGSTSTNRTSSGKQVSEKIVNELTPEEAYLLNIFHRYREPETANPIAADGTTTAPSDDKQLSAKRSTSPVPNGAKVSRSPMSAPRRIGDQGTGSKGPAAAATAPARSPVPIDALTRTKMVLMEKKRQAAAAGLTRVCSAGAGGLKKAKIKIAGALPSAATVMLDPLKYPASGFLLTQEFHSFERAEDAGDQDYVPTEPLVKALKKFGLAEDGNGDGGSVGASKAQFNETLVIRLTVPPHSQSWGINICPSEHKDFSEILFHFNPRRRFVAMNNREDNVWGQQEKHMPGPKWPDLFNVSIHLAVQIDEAGFHIAIDGKYCTTFVKRKELPMNGEDLTLQIMTADDYGTNLGLVVHEIWWGHKQTMPGRPGSATKERQSKRASDPWRAGDDDDAFVDLHVGNLPAMPSSEQQEAVRTRLNDIFQPFGVIQVRVLHREKSFGFVKFRDHNGAAKALEELSEVEINGRVVRLSKAASSSR